VVRFGVKQWRRNARAKFQPDRCNVSPLRGEKTSKSVSEEIKYGRVALRAMLPVKKLKNPSPSKLGMVIEDLERVLAPRKRLGMTHSFAARGR